MQEQFDSRSHLFFLSFISSFSYRNISLLLLCTDFRSSNLMLFCYIISFNILVHINFVIYPMSDIMLSAEKATSPTAFINTLLLKKLHTK